MNLFRKEALDHVAKRLSWPVILATPLPFKLYAALAIITVISAVFFLSFSSYTRHETVIGVHVYGQTIPLQPGMLLTADIVFDRRTLIEWLFDPIYAAVK